MDFNFLTEADIQFLLGNKLKSVGFKPLFERNFELPDWDRTKRSNSIRKVRVDVVVTDGENIICCIEVKNFKEKGRMNTRQALKYKALGYPYFYCWNEDYIDEVVQDCLSLI